MKQATTTTPVCAGYNKDCGEDATISLESSSGKSATTLCEECAEEYDQYLIAFHGGVHV